MIDRTEHFGQVDLLVLAKAEAELSAFDFALVSSACGSPAAALDRAPVRSVLRCRRFPGTLVHPAQIVRRLAASSAEAPL